jgi:outer membrane receptor protein involved in Fe transport
VRLSITGFENRIESAIANVTIGTNLRQRQNIAQIHAQGVEVGAEVTRGMASFSGSLAWTDADLRNGLGNALTGKRPAQTPRLAASATLAIAPAIGWRVAATVRHIGQQFEDDLQQDSLPAATTVDAFILLPLIGRASLLLRGENVFDAAVITRNSGGSIDLGAPRTLWAGLRLGI